MEKLSHAYIISSPSAELRSLTAARLAAKHLCSGDGIRPCGVCRDCRKLSAGVHPDLTLVRRLPNDKGVLRREIVIGQIRDMISDAYILPNEASGKVYIIEEAETMNPNAQNAALKLLEEPPPNVTFLLLTSNSLKLLPTVRSRCVELKVNGEEDSVSPEARAMAEGYLDCIVKNDPAELLKWCVSHEGSSQILTAEFLNEAKRGLADMLGGRRECDEDDRYALMDCIRLIDRCLEHMQVNTGIKQIFGLLAVRSLPVRETRKQV